MSASPTPLLLPFRRRRRPRRRGAEEDHPVDVLAGISGAAQQGSDRIPVSLGDVRHRLPSLRPPVPGRQVRCFSARPNRAETRSCLSFSGPACATEAHRARSPPPTVPERRRAASLEGDAPLLTSHDRDALRPRPTPRPTRRTSRTARTIRRPLAFRGRRGWGEE